MAVREVEDIRCFGSVLGNFSCSWTLKNFSKLETKTGLEYRSSRFLSREHVIWYLSISPGGQYQWEDDEVVCSLRCSNARMNSSLSVVNVSQFQLSYRNTIGEVLSNVICRDKQFVFFFEGDPSVPLSIKRETLCQKLVDDTLIVLAEGLYTLSSEFKLNLGYAVSPFAKLSEDFMAMLKAGANSDVLISVGETDIPVHSDFLVARSKMFAAMFRHDTIESKSRRIVVTDFDLEIFLLMLQFVYSANVEAIDAAQALELLRAADKYQIDDLKTHCSNYLICHLDDTNVMQLLVSADMFNAGELKKKSIEYFCKNRAFVSFENHRCSLKQRPNVMCDLIKAMQKI